MRIKQTIRAVMLGSFFVLSIVGVQFTLNSSASALEKCGGVDTAIIKCDQGDGKGDAGVENSGIWGILMIILNILLGGVAVLALGGIVYGAVLYTSAGGNPEQVKKAMGIFTNVVIGVVAFAGMWVLLNFLIPGGAFEDII